jgi:tetratricopeptide (TPR) repeat protein
MNPSPFNTQTREDDAATRRHGDAVKDFFRRSFLLRSSIASVAALPRRRGAASVSVFILISLLAFAVACKHGATSTLERAAAAWDAGDYAPAAEEYERFLYQYPTGDASLGARFKLANIYYINLHHYDQARAHYQEFLRQDSAHAEAAVARERLAEVLAELGRTYEAIAEYENLNPSEASQRRRIRLKIADVYFEEKNFSQALTEYQKVIDAAEYDDLAEQAYMRKASIYIARSQYQLALDAYQKLAVNSPDAQVQRRAQFGLADCYAGLSQFDEAIKTLRAIKDEREQTHIAQRIAELEQQRREAAQARSGLQR